MSEYSELKKRYFSEGDKKMSSVSLIDGHIDPIENETESEYARLKEKYFGEGCDTE